MVNRFQYLKKFDWILFSAVILLLSFGLAELYSVALGQEESSLVNFNKQIIFIILGLALMFLIAFFDYYNLRSYGSYFYLFGVFILIAVLFWGSERRGTKGWFYFWELSIQPVEFIKIFLIIYLARYFSDKTVKLNSLKHLLISGLATGILVFLVLMQPDLGSAIILVLLWISLIFISGFKLRYIITIFLVGAIALGIGWAFFFQPYQKERILTFIDQGSNNLDQGYNITQAKIAVGSGGLTGRGLGFGSQSQLKFLPEAQNDFIFAVIAEELGFLGVILVFIFFAVIFVRLYLSANSAKNDFGIYIILGIGSLIFIEMFINIGMNIGVLPVIGISLPFLSYGGSSIVATLMLIGIAQSIIIRSKIKY